MRYASASRWFLVLSVAIGVAQVACVIAFSWLITQAVVDVFIGGRPVGDVLNFVGLAALVVVVRSLLAWAADVAAARAATTVKAQLRAKVLDAVARLGPAWTSSQRSADIAMTATRGLDALDAYFSRYLPQLVLTAVATPLFVLVLLWQDWISALVVIITLPLIPVFMVLVGFFTRDVQQKQWGTLRALSTHFSDVIEGLSTLTIFGRARHQVGVIATVADEYRARTMKVLRVSFMSGFVLELAATLSVALVAVGIGTRLIAGDMTLWVGLFVLLITPEAYLPIRSVGTNYHAAAEGIAAADDVFAILDAAAEAEPDETKFVPPVAQRGSARQGLQINDLTVVYPGASAPAIEHFDLSIRPGQIVALMGRSGVGKSTVFAALLGFAPAQPAVAQPERIAWSGQQTGLLAGSVSANVSLGDPQPDLGLVRTSLLRAQLGEVVTGATILGPAGAGLSGGEAQRLSLARAYYRLERFDLPVLLLDEPTSALDDETEARVIAGVREIASRRSLAVAIITHREAVAAAADRIVHLSEQASHV